MQTAQGGAGPTLLPLYSKCLALMSIIVAYASSSCSAPCNICINSPLPWVFSISPSPQSTCVCAQVIKHLHNQKQLPSPLRTNATIDREPTWDRRSSLESGRSDCQWCRAWTLADGGYARRYATDAPQELTKVTHDIS